MKEGTAVAEVRDRLDVQQIKVFSFTSIDYFGIYQNTTEYQIKLQEIAEIKQKLNHYAELSRSNRLLNRYWEGEHGAEEGRAIGRGH